MLGFPMKKLFLTAFLLTISSLFAASYKDACKVLQAEKSLTGDFIQKRTIAASGKSLKSSGLFTVGPDKILWETKKPVKNTVTITKGKITQVDSRGRTNELDGQENQVFMMISRMISGLFSGNREEIEEYFDIDFSSREGEADWTMILYPKDSTIARGIKSLTLCGNLEFLNSMKTTLTSADSISYEFYNQKVQE